MHEDGDSVDPSDNERGASLEAAVKGVAQGLTGKLKEAAGELLGDESLEREGIAQQEAAERRRAGGDSTD